MVWTKALVVSLLTSFIILSISIAVESAAVKSEAKADKNKSGPQRQVFMAESDASNFFKRRGRSRRSPGYYAERQAEQRVYIAQSERRREFNEEQRNEYENWAEEDRNEQQERSREVNEQFREFHYDGLSPQFYWFH